MGRIQTRKHKRQLLGQRLDRRRRIEYQDNHIRSGNRLHRTLDSDALDGLFRFVDTGRINETVHDPVKLETFLDGIARRPGDIGDDGPVIPEQGIQQCALAGIRGTDDGDWNPILDGIAGVE